MDTKSNTGSIFLNSKITSYIKNITKELNLAKEPKKYDKISTDSRTITSNNIFIALVGENHDGHDFIKDCIDKGVDFIIVQDDKWKSNQHINTIESNKSIQILVTSNTLDAYQDIAKGYLHDLDITKICITGSNGKTTIKNIVSSLISTKYKVYSTQNNDNNQIGVPKTILNTPVDTEVLVLEIGMNTPNEISHLSKIIQPDYCIITNTGSAHIGNLDSLESIRKEKASVMDGLHSNSILIIDEETKEFEEFSSHSFVKNYSQRCIVYKSLNEYNFAYAYKQYLYFRYNNKNICFRVTPSSRLFTVDYDPSAAPLETHLYLNIDLPDKAQLNNVDYIKEFSKSFKDLISLKTNITSTHFFPGIVSSICLADKLIDDSNNIQYYKNIYKVLSNFKTPKFRMENKLLTTKNKQSINYFIDCYNSNKESLIQGIHSVINYITYYVLDYNILTSIMREMNGQVYKNIISQYGELIINKLLEKKIISPNKEKRVSKARKIASSYVENTANFFINYINSSTQAALYLIIGDILELGKHSQSIHNEVGNNIKDLIIELSSSKNCFKNIIVYTYGDASKEIINVLKDSKDINEFHIGGAFTNLDELGVELQNKMKDLPVLSNFMYLKGSRSMKLEDLIDKL